MSKGKKTDYWLSEENYSKWVEQLIQDAAKEHGDLVEVFRTCEFKDYPPVDTSGYDSDADDAMWRREALKNQIKSRQVAVDREKEIRPKLWAIAMGRIPETSVQKMRDQDSEAFQKSKIEQCPKQLIKLVRDTHKIAGNSNNAAVRKLQARMAAQGCVQRAEEYIGDYLERFKDAHAAAVDMGNSEKDTETMAMDFYHGLHSRYQQFKADLMNQASLGAIKMPTTLSDMYQKAAQHKVVAQGKSVKGLVSSYVTTVEGKAEKDSDDGDRDSGSGDRDKGGGGRGGRGGGGRGGGGRGGAGRGGAGRGGGGREDDRPFPYRCFNCHERGHRAFECPKPVDEVEEAGGVEGGSQK